MNHKLKLLGMAITAIAAFSAFSAAGTQAVTADLSCTTSTNNCVITSQSNDHVFSFAHGKVKCIENGGVKGARFEVTTSKTSNTATVTAAYGNNTKGCTYFGVAGHVIMNGCHYVFNGVTDGNLTVNVNIVCPNGGSIIVDATAIDCTITVPPQNNLSHVVFSNSGNDPGNEPNTDVNAQITLAKIVYGTKGLECPTPEGTYNDGTYNGTATLEAFNDNGTGGPPYKEGTAVGLHATLAA